MAFVYPGCAEEVVDVARRRDYWHLQKTQLKHAQTIVVAITQGNLCPRSCRYESDFRKQNYKSGVSQEKKPYTRMSQLEKMFLQKSEGFTA